LSGLFDRDAFTTAIRRLAFIGAFLLGLSVPLLNSSIPAWTGFPIRREIARVISPDGREDAVLTEEHAKVVFSRSLSKVRIVPHGSGIEKGSLVFSGERLANAQLVWTDPRLLEIRYNRGRVDYFTNEAIAAPKEKDLPIEVRLVPLSPDFSYLQAASNPKGLAEPPLE
jgi:hypothetical protein